MKYTLVTSNLLTNLHATRRSPLEGRRQVNFLAQRFLLRGELAPYPPKMLGIEGWGAGCLLGQAGSAAGSERTERGDGDGGEPVRSPSG